MTRPQHLNCPNTPNGIRRINQEQEAYDKDPEGYEREQQRIKEKRMQMEEERWYNS